MSKIQMGRWFDEEYLLGHDKYSTLVTFQKAPVIRTYIINI